MVGGDWNWNHGILWLSIQLGIYNHPNWRTHIFQKGRYTTNQWLFCVVFMCSWFRLRYPEASLGGRDRSDRSQSFPWTLIIQWAYPDRGTATQCDRQWKDAVCLQECPADLPSTERTRSGQRSKKHVSQQILEARDLTWNLTVAIL